MHRNPELTMSKQSEDMQQEAIDVGGLSNVVTVVAGQSMTR